MHRVAHHCPFYAKSKVSQDARRIIARCSPFNSERRAKLAERVSERKRTRARSDRGERRLLLRKIRWRGLMGTRGVSRVETFKLHLPRCRPSDTDLANEQSEQARRIERGFAKRDESRQSLETLSRVSGPFSSGYSP